MIAMHSREPAHASQAIDPLGTASLPTLTGVRGDPLQRRGRSCLACCTTSSATFRLSLQSRGPMAAFTGSARGARTFILQAAHMRAAVPYNAPLSTRRALVEPQRRLDRSASLQGCGECDVHVEKYMLFPV